jgi:hypothetical protein
MKIQRKLKRRLHRYRNHWRALVNYSHGYAWSCLKRDRSSGKTL